METDARTDVAVAVAVGETAIMVRVAPLAGYEEVEVGAVLCNQVVRSRALQERITCRSSCRPPVVGLHSGRCRCGNGSEHGGAIELVRSAFVTQTPNQLYTLTLFSYTKINIVIRTVEGYSYTYMYSYRKRLLVTVVRT